MQLWLDLYIVQSICNDRAWGESSLWYIFNSLFSHPASGQRLFTRDSQQFSQCEEVHDNMDTTVT